MAMKVFNNTLKGKYKAPRYRCFFDVDGVPGERVFRSLKGVNKLKQTAGIRNLQVITIQ